MWPCMRSASLVASSLSVPQQHPGPSLVPLDHVTGFDDLQDVVDAETELAKLAARVTREAVRHHALLPVRPCGA